MMPAITGITNILPHLLPQSPPGSLSSWDSGGRREEKKEEKGEEERGGGEGGEARWEKRKWEVRGRGEKRGGEEKVRKE